jgi:hypothetical protein
MLMLTPEPASCRGCKQALKTDVEPHDAGQCKQCFSQLMA